jgi:hypothetical protein
VLPHDGVALAELREGPGPPVAPWPRRARAARGRRPASMRR